MMSAAALPNPARPRPMPFYALILANAVSAVGDILTFLAVPWFVLQTTGSATQTGITAFFSTASVGVSAFLGSALVDRIGYKRASVLSDVTSGVSVALVPLLYHLGLLPFWGLLALVFVAGLLVTPGRTARAAIVPELAALARQPLERVSAATDGATRIAGFIGAPLGGVLIAFIGTSNLLWIDAATFGFSAALIAVGVPHVAAPAPAAASGEEQAGRRGYLRDLTIGMRYMLGDPLILSVIGVILVTNLLDAGFGGVLAPIYIKQVFGSPVLLGGLIASFGGAAFIGTLIFGAIGHRLPRRLTLGICFTLAGGTRFVSLALVPSVPVLLVISALAGLCIGPINPIFDTVAYERIPADLRARVFGAITTGAVLGMPLGGLFAGLSAAWLGPYTSLLIFGAVYYLATITLLINPTLKDLERRPSAAPAPAPAEELGDVQLPV